MEGRENEPEFYFQGFVEEGRVKISRFQDFSNFKLLWCPLLTVWEVKKMQVILISQLWFLKILFMGLDIHPSKERSPRQTVGNQKEF